MEKNNMDTVLFTTKNSIYQELGCDCWDKERDARKFMENSTKPVIAHPPCRAWGKFKGMAKPEPGEKQLTIEAIQYVNRNGGILEHPKSSDIWKTQYANPGNVLYIQQSDFGHLSRKDTGLYIVGCSLQELPAIPIVLSPTQTNMDFIPKSHREKTPVILAKWLLEILEIIDLNKNVDYLKNKTRPQAC